MECRVGKRWHVELRGESYAVAGWTQRQLERGAEVIHAWTGYVIWLVSQWSLYSQCMWKMRTDWDDKQKKEITQTVIYKLLSFSLPHYYYYYWTSNLYDHLQSHAKLGFVWRTGNMPYIGVICMQWVLFLFICYHTMLFLKEINQWQNGPFRGNPVFSPIRFGVCHLWDYPFFLALCSSGCWGP